MHEPTLGVLLPYAPATVVLFPVLSVLFQGNCRKDIGPPSQSHRFRTPWTSQDRRSSGSGYTLQGPKLPTQANVRDRAAYHKSRSCYNPTWHKVACGQIQSTYIPKLDWSSPRDRYRSSYGHSWCQQANFAHDPCHESRVHDWYTPQ